MKTFSELVSKIEEAKDTIAKRPEELERVFGDIQELIKESKIFFHAKDNISFFEERSSEITLLQSRFSKNKGDNERGIVSSSDFSLESNRINDTLLNQLSKLNSFLVKSFENMLHERIIEQISSQDLEKWVKESDSKLAKNFRGLPIKITPIPPPSSKILRNTLIVSILVLSISANFYQYSLHKGNQSNSQEESNFEGNDTLNLGGKVQKPSSRPSVLTPGNTKKDIQNNEAPPQVEPVITPSNSNKNKIYYTFAGGPIGGKDTERKFSDGLKNEFLCAAIKDTTCKSDDFLVKATCTSRQVIEISVNKNQKSLFDTTISLENGALNLNWMKKLGLKCND